MGALLGRRLCGTRLVRLPVCLCLAVVCVWLSICKYLSPAAVKPV